MTGVWFRPGRLNLASLHVLQDWCTFDACVAAAAAPIPGAAARISDAGASSQVVAKERHPQLIGEP